MDKTGWITHCFGRFLIDLPPKTDANGYAHVAAPASTSVSIHTVVVAPRRNLNPEMGA